MYKILIVKYHEGEKMLGIKFKLFQRKYRKMNKHNKTIIMNFCDLSKIIIGKKSYGQINLTDFSPANTKLYIGNYCSIAPNVHFLLGGEHQIKTISTYPFKVLSFGQAREAGSKGNIIVNDDVWICEGAIICSGVTIGQGAVIAAGAVVTKDVEPYAIVGGNPAKLIKCRFCKELIDELKKMNITDLFDKINSTDFNLIYKELDINTLKVIKEKYNV